MKKLTELTVDRSRWNPGRRYGRPALRNANGFQCCLGFLVDEILPKEFDSFWKKDNVIAFPSSLPRAIVNFENRSEVNAILCAHNIFHNPLKENYFEREAVAINDDISITDEVREKKLIALFARRGITLKFEGEFSKSISGPLNIST